MAKSRGNGQGSVTKIKDTKGKIKYQIRVTVGSEFDAEKEKFRYISKSLGVYKTKAEAEAVLAEYNSSPYDLTNKITTVGELYDYWSEKASFDQTKFAFDYYRESYFLTLSKKQADELMSHGYQLEYTNNECYVIRL